jgi:hypothetical protein
MFCCHFLFDLSPIHDKTIVLDVLHAQKIERRRHLNQIGHLTFFGHSVSALARWPLTKSKYFISLSK